MYWDSEKQTYMPAPSESTAAETADAAAAAASASAAGSKEPKEKKEKPKSKTAQQVQIPNPAVFCVFTLYAASLSSHPTNAFVFFRLPKTWSVGRKPSTSRRRTSRAAFSPSARRSAGRRRQLMPVSHCLRRR